MVSHRFWSGVKIVHGHLWLKILLSLSLILRAFPSTCHFVLDESWGWMDPMFPLYWFSLSSPATGQQVVWEYKKLFSFRLLEAFFLSTPDVLLKSEAILIPELLGQHLGLSTCSHLLAFFGSSSWCCRQRMLPALSMNKWCWGRQARSQLQPHLPVHPKRIQDGENRILALNR